ncbi:MAG TPA: cellobiose phosphorylase [Ruminiclostridium sp.]
MAVKNEYGWKFTSLDDASFIMRNPVKNSRMYFPLCNNKLKSYVTPELKGDILLNFYKYLTIPKSTEDLHHTKDSRNFWLNIENKGVWSCTGVSAESNLKTITELEQDEAEIEAGIGWIKYSRINTEHNLKSEMTIFIPSNDDPVELIKVEITNTGKETVEVTPSYAVAMYGRTTENLRDHRDVSTLCNRLIPNGYGIVMQPFMIHDEKKCYQNPTRYSVLGYDGDGKRAPGGWGRMFDYIGENGSMEAPEAVYYNKAAQKFEDMTLTGEETVGAIKFNSVLLKPGEKKRYIIIEGITDNFEDIEAWATKKYNSIDKIEAALEETKLFWQDYVDSVKFEFPDKELNKFLKWVNFQPFLRKVFGSSYLPDYGYGTGKRYWRELWQDLLAIIMADPYGTKADIMNNYNGVKLDGSNATLVGDNPGEFAHRSGLGRTWSDHGVWPYFATRLFLDLTGDLDVLFEKAPYFKDHISRRGKGTDPTWTESYGLKQKTVTGEIYYGTVLEHLLVQNLTSFYNVGTHNITLLEAGDWDDTMDMAREHGETVQFTAFYAANLLGLCECLEKLHNEGVGEIELCEEMVVLLDRLPDQAKIEYGDHKQKQGRLQHYYDLLDNGLSGKLIKIDINSMVEDLKAKAESVIELINSQEFIKVDNEYSFYNAYYTDTSRMLGGKNEAGSVNISLTPQAYMMILGLTGQDRAREIQKSVNKYLRNEFGGYILRSDHKEQGLIDIMGRGFGLAFKTRENGGQYNHMAVKYMNGLYTNNLVKEGYEVFSTITGFCMNSEKSRIFPGVPASIDSKSSRGSYNYLTGSGSWLIFSIITEIFGIKSNLGDLNIYPKLVKEQFNGESEIKVHFIYLEKKITMKVKNEQKLDWGEYRVGQVKFNGIELSSDFYYDDHSYVKITKQYFEHNSRNLNIIEIELVNKAGV